MRLFFRVLIPLFALSFSLTSCGLKSKSFDEVSVKRGPNLHLLQPVNTARAADRAIGQHRAEVFLWVASYHVEEQPRTPRSEPRPVVSSSPQLQPMATDEATPSPWACIAEAETGTDWTMHGSTYSTAFGVINDIVYQYATGEEQAQIFSGTASPETQIAVVSRFSDEHGFGGWGELTKQKCGL